MPEYAVDVAIENPERLRKVPLFAELPEKSLERLAQLAQPTSAPAGQTLTQRDDPGSDMYVIEAGTVAIEA